MKRVIRGQVRKIDDALVLSMDGDDEPMILPEGNVRGEMYDLLNTGEDVAVWVTLERSSEAPDDISMLLEPQLPLR